MLLSVTFQDQQRSPKVPGVPVVAMVAVCTDLLQGTTIPDVCQTLPFPAGFLPKARTEVKEEELLWVFRSLKVETAATAATDM